MSSLRPIFLCLLCCFVLTGNAAADSGAASNCGPLQHAIFNPVIVPLPGQGPALRLCRTDTLGTLCGTPAMQPGSLTWFQLKNTGEIVCSLLYQCCDSVAVQNPAPSAIIGTVVNGITSTYAPKGGLLGIQIEDLWLDSEFHDLRPVLAAPQGPGPDDGNFDPGLRQGPPPAAGEIGIGG